MQGNPRGPALAVDGLDRATQEGSQNPVPDSMGIRCHPRGFHAGLVVGHNQPMKIQLLQPCGDMNLDLWVEKQTPLDGYATQQVSMFPLNGIPPILILNRHRRYDNNFLAAS